MSHGTFVEIKQYGPGDVVVLVKESKTVACQHKTQHLKNVNKLNRRK